MATSVTSIHSSVLQRLRTTSKTILLALPLVAGALTASGQENYYTDLEKKIRSFYDEQNYMGANQVATELLQVYPDNFEANVLQAASLMYLNKPREASKYVDIAHELDPSASAPLTAKAYLKLLEGRDEQARQLLQEAVQFDAEPLDVKTALEEMTSFGKLFGRPAEFAGLAAWFQKTAPSLPKWPSISSELTALNMIGGNARDMASTAETFVDQFESINRHDLALLAYFYGAKRLEASGFPSEANELAVKGYAKLKSVGLGVYPTISSQLIWQLIQFSNNKADFGQAVQYGADISDYQSKSILPLYEIETIQMLSTSYARLTSGSAQKNTQTGFNLALKAYEFANRYQYISSIVSAANAIALCATGLGDPPSVSQAIAMAEQGYLMGERYRLETKDVILTNLALLYWGQGPEGAQKCVTLYRNQIDKSKRDKNLDRASLLLNNLGSLYYFKGDLDQAIVYFEESAALAVSGLVFSNVNDRLSYYQNQMSAYQWLVGCYARQGDKGKTFEAMERSRARVLSERLAHQEMPTPVIADLQDMLQSDEACIMYHVFSGYEIVVLVVTKKYANVIFHTDDRFIGDIRDTYFNKGKTDEFDESPRQSRWFEVIHSDYQRTQVYRSYNKEAVAPRTEFDRVASLSRKYFEAPGRNDAFLYDILSRYQKYLIVPVLNRLSGIKTLIISPNDQLSFLPFEAFKTFDGKFLVEKFNIRYLHSSSILQQLNRRQYPASRKPLLAMGGAIYEAMEEEPLPLKDAADLTLLRAQVANNQREGKSLRKAYASLFGTKPLTALPGTVEEVQNISRVVSGADVFTGRDMSENRIKQMSATGELQRYKMVHLATHGFVVAEVPDLSGVAMSIAPTEHEGEDGFLNVAEVAGLKLNADITVLSACQTALGKLYVGEGVTGLTQSLLLAGSNAALVSLWPVSDASTMKFMSDFYKEVAKGKPYAQVVNDLKRKFIKGDYGKGFQHPYFWAPFIYYGR